MRGSRARLGIWAAGFACFITLYATQPMLPVLARDFGLPLPRMGETVTATLVAVALLAPLVGQVSDRLGRRRLITTAAWILVVPTALAGLAPTYETLLLCRFAQGICMPFIFALVITFISEEWSGLEALRLTGDYQVAAILGGFCGRVGNGLLTDYLGWRASFLVSAVAIAGCAALTGFLPRERRFVRQADIGASIAAYRSLLSDRKLVATFCLGFTVLFALVGGYTFANVHLAGPPWELGPAALGLVFSVYLIGTVTTGQAARLATRIGRRRSVMIWVAVALGGILLTLSSWLPLIIAGLGLLAAGVFPEQTLSLNFIASAAPKARATAVGIYTTAYYLGGAAGGVLPAAIWHVAGWPGCVAMVAALQLFVLGVAITCWQDNRQAETA